METLALKIAFRADASLVIGNGHVMRCLTLADALSEHGVESVFLARALDGHLHSTVELRGYPLLRLGSADTDLKQKASASHDDWLGVDLEQDIADTTARLTHFHPDWLIVDHYALGETWEAALRPLCSRIMAIDDLANRNHAVDLLLDQNLGTTTAHYSARVPPHCELLLGPQYTLLRREFAALRSDSLSRRRDGRLSTILVTMGGVDLEDTTGLVLDALRHCENRLELKVIVVMGPHAPWRERIISMAAQLPFQTMVLVNPPNMAELMRDADLAIGASGSTSWERCCLGLPTLQIVIADNQRRIAVALSHAGAAYSLQPPTLATTLVDAVHYLAKNPSALVRMSEASAAITDGGGTERVAQHFLRGHSK